MKNIFIKILNGLFTEDYFVNMVKCELASHVLNDNSKGTLVNIKVCLQFLFRDNQVHYYKFICHDDNSHDKVVVYFEFKPTRWSSLKCYIITMRMKGWNKSLLTSFSDEQIIDLHTDIDMFVSKL
jgi:hypothetical protein